MVKVMGREKTEARKNLQKKFYENLSDNIYKTGRDLDDAIDPYIESYQKAPFNSIESKQLTDLALSFNELLKFSSNEENIVALALKNGNIDFAEKILSYVDPIVQSQLLAEDDSRAIVNALNKTPINEELREFLEDIINSSPEPFQKKIILDLVSNLTKEDHLSRSGFNNLLNLDLDIMDDEKKVEIFEKVLKNYELMEGKNPDLFKNNPSLEDFKYSIEVKLEELTPKLNGVDLVAITDKAIDKTSQEIKNAKSAQEFSTLIVNRLRYDDNKNLQSKLTDDQINETRSLCEKAFEDSKLHQNKVDGKNFIQKFFDDLFAIVGMDSFSRFVDKTSQELTGDIKKVVHGDHSSQAINEKQQSKISYNIGK